MKLSWPPTSGRLVVALGILESSTRSVIALPASSPPRGCPRDGDRHRRRPALQVHHRQPQALVCRWEEPSEKAAGPGRLTGPGDAARPRRRTARTGREDAPLRSRRRPLDDLQLLVEAARPGSPSGRRGELGEEGRAARLGRRRDEDAVEGGVLGPAVVAVRRPDRDVRRSPKDAAAGRPPRPRARDGSRPRRPSRRAPRETAVW